MDAEFTEQLVARVRGWTEERRRKVTLALLEAPPLFDIEVASACNITCSFCPREAMARPRGLMSEETFGEVLEFLPPGAVIMLSGLGDALLHPGLESFVARLTERRLSTCIVTNGILLTPARQQGLINAGIAQIQVSVHGLSTGALAPIVTRGARPELVRQNLEYLASHRPAGLRLRINFVETPENAHALEDVRRWASALGAEFFFRRLHARGGTISSPRSAEPSEGCGIFGAVTFITVQGHILSCINDIRGTTDLGHVRQLTWQGLCDKKRAVARRGEWFDICGRCDDDYRWVILAQHGVDPAG